MTALFFLSYTYLYIFRNSYIETTNSLFIVFGKNTLGAFDYGIYSYSKNIMRNIRIASLGEI